MTTRGQGRSGFKGFSKIPFFVLFDEKKEKNKKNERIKQQAQSRKQAQSRQQAQPRQQAQAATTASLNQGLNKNNKRLLDIFFHQYTSYYVYDLIYSLPAFTDCHALDATRSRFMLLKHYTDNHANYEEKILGNWSENHELDVMFNDEFINEFIIHKKGNK